MITNPAEGMVWMKYLFFEAGSSPRELRKCRMKDIEEIMDIKRAVEERESREQKINKMRANMKY